MFSRHIKSSHYDRCAFHDLFLDRNVRLLNIRRPEIRCERIDCGCEEPARIRWHIANARRHRANRKRVGIDREDLLREEILVIEEDLTTAHSILCLYARVVDLWDARVEDACATADHPRTVLVAQRSPKP